MGKIKIVGLGPGSAGQIGLEAYDFMQEAELLILRTEIHPSVSYLKEHGIKFTTCDDLYNAEDSFDTLYGKISDRVLALSQEYDQIVYAVPGHPLVAEKSVELLLEKAKGLAEIDILPAMSFIDAILSAIKIDPVHGLKVLDGLSLDRQKPDPRCGNIITQVYDRYVASEVMLRLMETYEDEAEIVVIKAAGVEGLERIERMPLYELDRVEWVDYLTSIYIGPVDANCKRKTMDDLLDVMAELRGEHGCDWDKRQTQESLRPYLIEETYEVLDAIDRGDVDAIVEELGDLLLQVVFHAQIARENDEFDINDIISGITNKLILRHPHVFGNVVVAKGEGGALNLWEAAKREEKSLRTYTEVLCDIPHHLPALMRSYKIQQKAALSGFDWEKKEDAFAKIEEEICELKEVYQGEERERIIEELGDLLFAVVNVARFLKIQPELALNETSKKFIARFAYVESAAERTGTKMENMTLAQLESLWQEAKSKKW